MDNLEYNISINYFSVFEPVTVGLVNENPNAISLMTMLICLN